VLGDACVNIVTTRAGNRCSPSVWQAVPRTTEFPGADQGTAASTAGGGADCNQNPINATSTAGGLAKRRFRHERFALAADRRDRPLNRLDRPGGGSGRRLDQIADLANL
jgi:hypothetical protein